jgi:hypothetical protein
MNTLVRSGEICKIDGTNGNTKNEQIKDNCKTLTYNTLRVSINSAGTNKKEQMHYCNCSFKNNCSAVFLFAQLNYQCFFMLVSQRTIDGLTNGSSSVALSMFIIFNHHFIQRSKVTDSFFFR